MAFRQSPSPAPAETEEEYSARKYRQPEPSAPTPPAQAEPEPEPTPQEDEPQISWEDVEAANRADIQARIDKRKAEIAAQEAAAKAQADKAAADAEAARLAAIPRLSNGEEQLPLDTVPSHKHSVIQLRDLAQRQREAARSEPRANGWRGSKF